MTTTCLFSKLTEDGNKNWYSISIHEHENGILKLGIPMHIFTRANDVIFKDEEKMWVAKSKDMKYDISEKEFFQYTLMSTSLNADMLDYME